jgi:hypothetical protein
MTGRHTLAAIVTVLAAAQLAACTYQPAPTYSYYAVPCAPTPAVGGPPAPAASPGGISPNTTAPPATAPTAPVAPDAAATPQWAAPGCVAAVPNYGYAAGYPPYWDYGWPYYGSVGIGVGGFIGGDFDRRFHDHDFHHDHGFHGGFHGEGFHGGLHGEGFHGGGFHGGGFHGGGGHGGGRG